jgi:hypothetical protein
MRVTSTSANPGLARSDPPTPPRATGATTRGERLRTAARRWGPDALVCAGYLILAIWLTKGLWPHPTTRTLALNRADQTLVEWFLSYGSRVWLGDFSLVTDRLNAPDGVNLLTNAATVGLGAIFAPVTWLFGAPVTFAVIMAVNLAATAAGWYLLFSRTFKASRAAAAIGGAFCGFAPGMVSQANSHLHMTAQWLVPPLIWCVVTLARAAIAHDNARLVRTGIVLGLLVTVQVFIGEETLFLLAMSLALVAIVYVAFKRPPWVQLGGFAAGLLIAAGVSVLPLAYPLWLQFQGPQSVPNGVFSPDYFSADLASFIAYSPLSVAGSPGNARLSTGPAEYNTFLGGPLILVVVVLAIWLRRQAIAVACSAAIIVMAALSLGPRIVVNEQATSHAGPYVFLRDLPVVDGALPMRFALAMIPLIAVLLVLAWDKASEQVAGWQRFALAAALGVALIPLLPTPLPTEDRNPVPLFYSEGHWRECASSGQIIIPVPLPTPTDPEAMRYATAANVAFGMPEGFFIGPYGRGGKATVGTWKVPTSALLAEVARSGKVPRIDDGTRAQARTDLARWNAACVVLTDTQNGGSLRTTLEQLLGPGRAISDAIVWPVAGISNE